MKSIFLQYPKGDVLSPLGLFYQLTVCKTGGPDLFGSSILMRNQNHAAEAVVNTFHLASASVSNGLLCTMD